MKFPPAYRAALAVFILGGAAAPLVAQVADTSVFPPVPSSVPKLLLPLNPADSGFGAWRRIPIPRHDKTAAAWTMRAGNWDFLLGTPRAMDAMDSSRIIDTTLANCRKPLNISEADSARVASARPWGAFDALVDDRPVFVISIMPVLRNFTECGWKNLGRPAMIRRGLRFVTTFEYDPRRDPTSAVLLSRLRPVTPSQLARAPVMVMARGGAPGQSTDQIRLYIPFDAIAPGLTGDMPATELMIWTKAGGEPDHIVLPSNIMHIMWWEYLHWRAARLATRDRATSAAPGVTRAGVVRVPTPSDDGLKTALRRQREGRFSESATITLERLTDEKLSVNDRRIALMSMANSFQVDDDAPAAAFVANDLTAMDPCALSGSDTQGAGTKVPNEAYTGLRSVGSMLDHTRNAVRCTSFRPGATLLRGLLVPGYGQYKTWSHLIGMSTTALTVAGALTSYGFLLSANQWYSHYQTNLSGYAPRDFTQAVSQRNNASIVLAGTIGIWVASAIEAEWQERVHASRLAAVHDFWFRPIMTGPAGSGSSVPGLAGGLRFEFR